MPERFAMKISEELLVIVEAFTGGTGPFEDDSYIILEMISPTKYTLEIASEDSVFEEYAKSGALHIL